MRISDWSSDVCSSDLPTVAVTDEKAEARSEAEMLEQRLITAINKGGLPPSDESRTLVGHLTQFHRRADKPAFWAMFDRCEREREERMDDVECIGDISPDVDARWEGRR